MTKHNNICQLFISTALCIFGCALLITGFIIPPTGEIHNSVLIAFGQILTFAGAIIGVDYKYKSEKHKQDN